LPLVGDDLALYGKSTSAPKNLSISSGPGNFDAFGRKQKE
jgi:hypothetical protein